MDILSVFVYAAIILVAVILVVLILLQPSKGGGFGSAFGGMGENVFGAHAVEHLSKLTVWMIAIFFVLALVLTALSAYSKKAGGDDSVMAGMVSETTVVGTVEETVESGADKDAAAVEAAKETVEAVKETAESGADKGAAAVEAVKEAAEKDTKK